ncbi:MAG: ATP-dependent sacrificial sulfur transferase LarE [Pyrinomonadaceae bacterium]|nr:ATP-dependent sacrificial sulfur transferase LarE [Pyrinomonadaceae bacterium]
MAQPQISHENTVTLTAEEKERNLRGLMREMQTVLVAYSGGVDSSYLALIAAQELGQNALCLTGISPSVSQKQRAEAAQIAEDFKFNFQTVETDELANPLYQANPTNRCYHCKTELYGKLRKIAQEKKIKFVLDGANTDDVGDYRPGRTAALEKAVRSPLIEVGLSKSEIRELSKKQKLPTWSQPSSPCLSSRIAYGVPVTIERLSKVERGEEIVRELGFREFRVRVHGELVRLEIAPHEMPLALNINVTEKLAGEFRKLGFKYVTLDLHGYRSGAMNEVLEIKS